LLLTILTLDKDFDIEKVVKKRKLENDFNKSIPFMLYIDSFIDAINNNNIDEIEKINKNININDIIFILYNNHLLTSEHLHFIMNNCTKYFNISPFLIKD